MIAVPPGTDPDEDRRRWLLNILVAGTLILSVLEILATSIAGLVGMIPPSQIGGLYATGIGALVATIVIFFTNRYGPAWLASVLFLASSTAVIVAFEDPAEVADGRSLLVFMVPVAVSAVLLRPWTTFVAALISSATIWALAIHAGIEPNPFAMIMFFAMAIISWLAALSLDQALRDLRVLNVELDQRVQDRTRELAESLAKNEAILEGIADGVIVFDNADRAIVANPAVTGLLGQPADEITGRDIEALMANDVNADGQETIINLLQDRETAHAGLKLEWGKKTLSVSMAPVRDNHDQVTGTVAVFRDFTREAEIDRMKSTFVSIASHELRTPLNAIMGYTEMLQEGIYGELSDKQRGATDRLMANTGHMLSLVNNLLDRARIEAGTLQLNISTFTPAELVIGVQGVMEVMAQAKGLQLTTHVAADVPASLSGDWQRLHQILINLINNAIKFTEEGSVDTRIYMPDADHWALEVSDTGCGIPEEALSYIFDPFRQVDDSATREYGGAGLGLSIVKQLVDLMEGEITLESEVGQGSTFTIVLPLVLNMTKEAEKNKFAEPA
jgi:PAS domain S-box-containing protein